MSNLAGLKPGDPIMVPVGKDDFEQHAVAEVTDRWLTDDEGRRYWIESGKSEWHNVTSRYAWTLPAHAAEVARTELAARLHRWGLEETHRRLTPGQLRQVLSLLGTFEVS
jgi:hypothetical protein